MKSQSLLSLLVLICAVASPRAQNSTGNTTPIFKKALQVTDIWSRGPLHMHARLTFYANPVILHGEYALYWVSKDQWRDDLTLPAYTQRRWAKQGQVWVEKSGERPTKYVVEFEEVRNLMGYLLSREGSEAGKETFVKMNEIRARCLDLKLGEQPCFDLSTGALLTSRDRQYTDFAPFADKVFPRTMRAFEQKYIRSVDVHIEKLETSSASDAKLFIPPQNLPTQTGCLNPVESKWSNAPKPKYPLMAQLKHVRGSVVVYSHIDSRGVPKDLKVMNSGGELLDGSTVSAMKKWRAEPATCSGTPVDSEKLTLVQYNLAVTPF